MKHRTVRSIKVCIKYCASILYIYFQSINILFYIFLFYLIIEYNYCYINLNKILACNINIICYIDETREFNKINKIYISKCNKKILKQVFINNLKDSIQSIIKLKFNKTLNIFVQNFITKVQIAGFINSKTSLNSTNNKKNYIILNFKTNPLIKKIKIVNYHKLMIPNKKLSKLFKFQLGSPANYNDIKNSIYAINLWYQSQGFKWINISLINSKDKHSIYLKVIEKKIISSMIICINKNNIKQKKSIYHSFIENELSLIKGKVLNKHYLDKIIKLLKKKYLLNHVEYIIKNKKNGLHIIFKYDITKNNINLSYNIYKSINRNFYNTDIFFKKYNMAIFNYLKNPLHTLRYIPKKILSLYLEYNFYKKLLRVYFQKYYLNYLINIKFAYNQYLRFNIYIKYPYIKIYKQIILLLSNQYSYIKNSINELPKFCTFYIIKLHNFNMKQIIYILTNSNLEVQTKYFVNNNLTIKSQINKLSYQYLKIYLSFDNYTETVSQKLYKLLKIIKSNFIYYQIQIKYNISFSYFHIFNIITFKTTYKLFLNLYNPILNKKIFINSYKQYLNIKLKYKFKMKLIKKHNHFFITLIEYNIYNNFITDILSLQIKQSFKQKNISFFSINSTYKINLNKYNVFYILTNYRMNLQTHNKAINNLIFGFGTQFNIPLKQMPYIRFEYIINSKQKAFLFIEK